MSPTRMRGGAHQGTVVAVLSCVALAIGIGIRTSFGLLIAVWSRQSFAAGGAVADYFHLTLAVVLGFLSFGLVQPLVGAFTVGYGYRVVFALSLAAIGIGTLGLAFAGNVAVICVIYSLVISIGVAGTSMVTATAAIADWFPRRKGLAAGFILAGGAAGQVVLVPVIEVLIELFDWRAALVATSMPILAFAVVCGAAMPSLRARAQQTNSVAVDTIRFHHHSPSILLILLSFGISGLVTTGFIETHLVSLVVHRGINIHVAATAMAVLGTANIVGTLLSGWAADKFGRIAVLISVNLVRAAALLGLFFADSVSGLLLFSLVFGLVHFAAVPSMNALVNDHFGHERATKAFGWAALSHQVGSAGGALIGAVFYVSLSSFSMAIGFCLCLSLFAIPCLHVLRTRFAASSVRKGTEREADATVSHGKWIAGGALSGTGT